MTSEFITDKEFSPEIGKCYEIHFGEIDYQGSVGLVATRIKVIWGDGKQNWIDLTNGNVRLDTALFDFEVRAYREMDPSDATKMPLKLFSL